jgi:hypothetical protein
MRKILILSLSLLAMLLPVANVSAAVPDMGTFDNGYNSFVDTEVCASDPWGFDVNATEHEYGSFQVFFDGSGNVTRVLVHLNYDAWISANGKTIVERDTWTFIGTPDSARDVGLTVQIKGVDGIVQLDAGQVVFDEDGNIEYVRGPHPQALGEVFCPALAP